MPLPKTKPQTQTQPNKTFLERLAVAASKPLPKIRKRPRSSVKGKGAGLRETQISTMIQDWLKAQGFECWRLNSGFANVKNAEGRSRNITLLPAGTPDLLCLIPGGRALFIEVKRPGNTPTKLQTEMHQRLGQLEFEVIVATSSREVEDYLLLSAKGKFVY